jgi:hypothetical protein
VRSSARDDIQPERRSAPDPHFRRTATGIAARVTARKNRDAETEAVELLDPLTTDRELLIGSAPASGRNGWRNT